MVVLWTVWRFVTSKVGMIVLTATLLLGFHFWDRARAVRAAKEGLVSVYEVTSLKAQLAAQTERHARLTAAHTQLSQRLIEDQQERDHATQRIKEYVLVHPDPPDDCRVTDDLLGVLRGDVPATGAGDRDPRRAGPH